MTELTVLLVLMGIMAVSSILKNPVPKNIPLPPTIKFQIDAQVLCECCCQEFIPNTKNCCKNCGAPNYEEQ